MIITLIGFRGSGKSTIGAMLAESLNLKFVDCDRELEQRLQKSISDIFSDQGEAYFRQQESVILQDLFQQDQLVIATGGGAVLDPENCQLLRTKGIIIWMQADLQTTMRRLENDESTRTSRPALTNNAWEQEVKNLLEQREPIYRTLSHHQIDTVNTEPFQIVEQIVQHVQDDKEAEK